MAAPQISLPSVLPAAAAMPASVKAALPALTVMLVNGALNLLVAVIILIAGWVVARWIGRWIHDGLAHRHFIDETLKPLIANFARYAVLAITIVAVLNQFGVQTTSLIAILGAAGLAIGLALQGTLSNVASGVMLLLLRPFRVSERIVAGDTAGTVAEIGLFRSVIHTDDGLYVSVPNATLFSATVTNTSREALRRTNFTVQVNYQEDLGQVRDLLLAAMVADARVLKTPEPTVELDKTEGVAATLSVQVWLDNSDFGGQRSDLQILANETLRRAKILPPLPLQAATLQNPQETGASDTPGGNAQSSGTKKSGASAEAGSTR